MVNEALFYLASNFWLGASHAVLPGHGKTIAAAYVVGTRGRPADAVVLGILVTLSHTSGVVLLFLLLASLGTTPSERIQGYLGLATGLFVVGLGLWMLRSRRDQLLESLTTADGESGGRGDTGIPAEHGHALERSHAHFHEHDSPDHDHPHSHQGQAAHEAGQPHPHAHDPEHAPHGHRHDHQHVGAHAHAHGGEAHSHGWGIRHRHRIDAVTGRRSNLPGLFAIAIVDGLIPDLAALGLLVSAMVKGKVLLGLSGVVAYSIGFAAVLAVVGIVAAISGQVVLRWLGGRWVTWLQTGAAALIVVVGIVLTLNAWPPR